MLIAVAMVPVYAQSDSIINLLQELWGLISMPILACFAVGLLFPQCGLSRSDCGGDLWGADVRLLYLAMDAAALHPHDVYSRSLSASECSAEHQPLGVLVNQSRVYRLGKASPIE